MIPPGRNKSNGRPGARTSNNASRELPPGRLKDLQTNKFARSAVEKHLKKKTFDGISDDSRGFPSPCLNEPTILGKVSKCVATIFHHLA
jgi:hypothetical protein